MWGPALCREPPSPDVNTACRGQTQLLLLLPLSTSQSHPKESVANLGFSSETIPQLPLFMKNTISSLPGRRGESSMCYIEPRYLKVGFGVLVTPPKGGLTDREGSPKAHTLVVSGTPVWDKVGMELVMSHKHQKAMKLEDWTSRRHSWSQQRPSFQVRMSAANTRSLASPLKPALPGWEWLSSSATHREGQGTEGSGSQGSRQASFSLNGTHLLPSEQLCGGCTPTSPSPDTWQWASTYHQRLRARETGRQRQEQEATRHWPLWEL